jgi:hypothetical protein
MKSLNIFTQFKWNTVPLLIYKSRYFIAVGFALLLLLSGCKKGTILGVPTSQNALEKYFEDNVLNKDIIVQFASDNGTEITAQYNGYIFKMFKNTYYDGPMTATSGTSVFTGTWSSNSDYSKLVITLPATTVAAFNFLNREWKFTKKAIPIMELAPWGTTEPYVLHMKRL